MTAALLILALVAGAAFAIVRASRRPAPEPRPATSEPKAETRPVAPAATWPVVTSPQAEEPTPVAAEEATPIAVEEPTPVAVEPVAVEPELEPAPEATSTVLVVDDETAVRSTTARILARAGYEVLQAGSADQALAILHERGPVDAMLSDVVMPGANGFELAGAVRDISPSTAVLLFTAYTSAAIDRHNLRGTSEARLLQKPLERHELLDAVATAVAASEA
jgi:CheY-like chemotaxis protein